MIGNAVATTVCIGFGYLVVRWYRDDDDERLNSEWFR